MTSLGAQLYLNTWVLAFADADERFDLAARGKFVQRGNPDAHLTGLKSESIQPILSGLHRLNPDTIELLFRHLPKLHSPIKHGK